jgi:hypothetical protein
MTMTNATDQYRQGVVDSALLVGALVVMVIASVLGDPGLLFYAAAGVSFGVALNMVADRIARSHDGLASFIWVVPLVIGLAALVFDFPLLGVISGVALVVCRVGFYRRIRADLRNRR